MKQERLEKMIRDELEENSSDRQTPVQSLLPTTPPGAPSSEHDRASSSAGARHFSPGKNGRLQ